MAGDGKREAWVVFSRRSGSVKAVYFREPSRGIFDPRDYGIVRTRLTERDITAAHHLRVNGGTVFHYLALAGV